MNNMELYCGDSNKLIKSISDKSIDLIIIDPPYLINTKGGKKGNSNVAQRILSLENELIKDKLTDGYDLSILNDLVRVMKTVNIYIWCNVIQIKPYLDFFISKFNCSFDMLIWNKTNAMPLFNNKYLGDKEYCLYFRKRGFCNPRNYEKARTVFYLPTNQKDKKLYGHPTIKPLSIIERLIENSSKENEIILDCFMGSGTTGVATVNVGGNRKFIGMEIEKKYFDIASVRINNAIEIKEEY